MAQTSSTYLATVADIVEGHTYVLAGVSGTIKVDRYTACYPYEHEVIRIHHVADDRGRGTYTYQQLRQQLGDHYVTGLDWSADLIKVAISALAQREYPNRVTLNDHTGNRSLACPVCGTYCGDVCPAYRWAEKALAARTA